MIYYIHIMFIYMFLVPKCGEHESPKGLFY